jgi:hypothetical protein
VHDVTSFYLRFDILNVTNAANFVDYVDEFYSTSGMVMGGHLNRAGNITGYPRTVRGSFGIKF